MIQNDKLNVMLIGEDIETCIVFKNAFSKLEKPCKVDFYNSLHKAMSEGNSENASKTDIIFLDTTKGATICRNEVRQIKDSKQFKDCSVVVYDSQSHLRDIHAIFAEGADAFINQPYYFPRLRKVLANIIKIDWNFDRYSADKITYFL